MDFTEKKPDNIVNVGKSRIEFLEIMENQQNLSLLFNRLYKNNLTPSATTDEMTPLQTEEKNT
jgi:hypothetical protein